MDLVPAVPDSSRAPSAPVFALLAARAAVALERAANRHETPWGEVKELGRALGLIVTTPRAVDAGPGRQALVPTEAADVVDRALVASGARHLSTVLELREEIERVAGALRQASATTAPTDLQQLRDLCIAMARAAQAQEPAPLYVRPGAGAQR